MPILSYIYEVLANPSVPKDGAAYAKPLPLAGAALPVVLISIVYATFVLKIGPKWMKNREPFQLKRAMVVYNLLQIVINLYMAIAASYYIYMSRELELSCVVKLAEDSTYKWLEVSTFYCYFINKIVDYMDTIFFVLRKNFRQITFLHVYHHMLMAFITYGYIRTHGYGGHGALVGLINSIVHAVMYAYYALSALRPNKKQTLWWKKYITKMQILQFIIMLAQQSWPLLFKRDCKFPKIWLLLTATQALTMLYLFGNFYRKAYWRKNSAANKQNDKQI